MALKSTKTSRRKVIQKVKAATFGTAIMLNSNLLTNNYPGKKYGPHRKAVADAMRAARAKKRSSGISSSSKSLRGVESINLFGIK